MSNELDEIVALVDSNENENQNEHEADINGAQPRRHDGGSRLGDRVD
jgi:hypothetical protein